MTLLLKKEKHKLSGMAYVNGGMDKFFFFGRAAPVITLAAPKISDEP